MIKVFLTGPIQIGKTSIIKDVLSQLNLSYGGFQTYFGIDRRAENRFLYINSADQDYRYESENRLVSFVENKRPQVDRGQFDNYGADLIRLARASKELIVMDECGNFEKEALIFQQEILRTLAADKPVLGVIKESSWGFTDRIRSHPQVCLLEVTKENRQTLAAEIIKMFQNL